MQRGGPQDPLPWAGSARRPVPAGVCCRTGPSGAEAVPHPGSPSDPCHPQHKTFYSPIPACPPPWSQEAMSLGCCGLTSNSTQAKGQTQGASIGRETHDRETVRLPERGVEK